MCLLRQTTTGDVVLDKYIAVLSDLKGMCDREEIINMLEFVRSNKLVSDFFQLLFSWKVIKLAVGDDNKRDAVFAWIYVKPDNVGESFIANRLASAQRQQASYNKDTKADTFTPKATKTINLSANQTTIVKQENTQPPKFVIPDDINPETFSKYHAALVALKMKCDNGDIFTAKQFTSQYKIDTMIFMVLINLGVISRDGSRYTKQRQVRWISDKSMNDIVMMYFTWRKDMDKKYGKKVATEKTTESPSKATVSNTGANGVPINDFIKLLPDTSFTMYDINHLAGELNLNTNSLSAKLSVGCEKGLLKKVRRGVYTKVGNVVTVPEEIAPQPVPVQTNQLPDVLPVVSIIPNSGDQYLEMALARYNTELASMDIVYNKMCSNYVDAQRNFDNSGKDEDRMLMDMYKSNIDVTKGKISKLSGKISRIEKLIQELA